MARRNIFQPPSSPVPVPTEAAVAEARPRFPNTGAMSGVKSTLRDLSSNAVREIDPAMIDDGGPKDRLAIVDADVADLAESIRLHGQQVPIMVRPLADTPGHYRIVYGRRRLRALRLVGISAKALVRSLTDEQAILAQGQENNLRLDPSFIEKALFATELTETGYDQSIILDALAIDKPMLSRMTKVARIIPKDVIQCIGAAHGIGRRRWEDLADLARDKNLDLSSLTSSVLDYAASLTSESRFAQLADAAIEAAKKYDAIPSDTPVIPVRHADGTRIAEIRHSSRALTIKFIASDEPAFIRWIRENAEGELTRLYETWKSATDGDRPKSSNSNSNKRST